MVETADAVESGVDAPAAVLGDELDVSIEIFAGRSGSGFLENGGVLVFRRAFAGMGPSALRSHGHHVDLPHGLDFVDDPARPAGFEGERHLPLAGAKEFHYLSLKHKLNDLRYDAFFAGTAWPNRADLIKNLIVVI